MLGQGRVIDCVGLLVRVRDAQRLAHVSSSLGRDNARRLFRRSRAAGAQVCVIASILLASTLVLLELLSEMCDRRVACFYHLEVFRSHCLASLLYNCLERGRKRAVGDRMCSGAERSIWKTTDDHVYALVCCIVHCSFIRVRSGVSNILWFATTDVLSFQLHHAI